jgi:tetratricopeptide (TPR) repeat protein
MASASEQTTAPGNAPLTARLMTLLRGSPARLRGLPGVMRARPLVSAGVGTGVLAVAAALGTVVWLLAASGTGADENLTLAAALEAYDAEDLLAARDIAQKLHAERRLAYAEVGGPLFVLGAVAARDAQIELNEMRRRQLYHVAARYLDEARNYGFPPDRRADGLYLLGLSFCESRQFAQSLPALRDALAQNPHRAGQLHRLLAEACFHDSPPQYDEALAHLSAYLADPALAPRDRHWAVLLQANIALDQGRFADAHAVLAQVPDDSSLRSEKLLLSGRLLLKEGDALAAAPEEGPAREKYTAAVKALRLAEGTDTTRNQTTPKAEYLLGIAYRKLGELPAAAAQFERTAQARYAAPEGQAALLEAAEVKRELGDHGGAVATYRRLLQAIGKPPSYHNPWLALDELRRRVQEAQGFYREAGNFKEAVELAQACQQLLESDAALELEAQTLRAWGESLLARAAQAPLREAPGLDDEGRLRLRESGRAYARLARLRRAARSYADELWNSASALLDGNDFRRAVLMLDAYLESVARARRAPALVALGEAYLALDRPADALAPLLECIDDFPTHPDTYHARLLAARAHLERDKLPDDKLPDQALAHLPKAKELLDANLHSATLTPRSVEWRDSLFELGRVLFREGLVLKDRARRAGLDSDDPQQLKPALEVLDGSHAAFQLASEKLSEAAQRYPDDDQALEARYLVAEARRHAADYAQRRSGQSAVEATRLALRQQAEQQLAAAAQAYDALIVDVNRRSDRRELSQIESGILRNAYFGKADALFEHHRHDEALEAYGAAADRFHDCPESLEALVQLARCQRELGKLDLARGSLERARASIDRMPADADYAQLTRFDRASWQTLLDWLIALYAKQQDEVSPT